MEKQNYTIQYGIACGPKSEEHVLFLIKTIIETANNINNIEMLLGVTEFVKQKKLKKNLEIFKNKIKIKYIDCTNKVKAGSISHGTTLNALFSNMNAKYGIMSDCDIALLMKDWDIKLINCLDKHNIIVGTEYEHKSKRIKYQHFPNAYFCLFYVEKLKSLGINWKPHKNIYPLKDMAASVRIKKVNPEKHGYICVDKNNIKLFSPLKLGVYVFLDTGYELFYKIKGGGYGGVVLNYNTKKQILLKKYSSHCAQEFLFNDVPIITHFSKARTQHNNNAIDKWRNKILKIIT